MSPAVPNGNAKNELSSERRMYQKPVEGRQNAMSARPSPVKSPGAGLSEEVPN
jgi:hypothetical protein